MRTGILTLGYHGVAADEDIHDPWVQRMQVPRSLFRVQLEFVGKHFDVVSADEIFEAASGKRRIHLSFDDGYVGVLEIASPLLREFGFPASVFVVTDAASDNSRLPPYIGRAAMAHCEPGQISLDSIGYKTTVSNEPSRHDAYSHISSTLKTGISNTVVELVDELISLLPKDQWVDINRRYRTEALLGWDKLLTISESGFTVGAHSRTHLSLSDRQPRSTVENEVRSSVETVRQHLGKCDWFAYPNGTAESWSEHAAHAAEKAGVKGAWTLLPGVIRSTRESDRYRLPRFSVPKNLDRMKLMLNTAFVRY